MQAKGPSRHTGSVPIKRELCKQEDEGWVELNGLVESLGPGQTEVPGYYPLWSVKDLLAHVAAWMAEAAKVLTQVHYGTYLKRDLDVDAMNEEFYEANRDLPLPVVRAEAFSARNRMLSEMNAIDPVTPEAEDWFEESGPRHYEEHLPRLREWVQELQVTGSGPAGQR
jgi:Mycothiol maleylpyruvate isomerase N-terminal domain